MSYVLVKQRAKPSEKVAGSEVTLASLRPAHAPAMVRWLSDPVVSANLGFRAAPTLAKTRTFIASSDNDAVCGRAIMLSGLHVGTIVLDQIDRRVGKARLHIYIGDERARGHGVGQRAVALATAHAFGVLDLHKVWLTVHVRNVGAIRAYLAAGFVLEGTHRREFLLNGERIDEHYMGILRDEVR
jgi:RimJ/RimL family protein N-acetyltransferase